MTARIVLEVPGEPGPREVELHDGDAVVVGRDPGEEPGPSAATRRVTVGAASVSATHLSARCADGALMLTDEHSRNGTWLRLPPGAPVLVPGHPEVVVRLGTLIAPDPTADQPADAVWRDRDDFHAGIVAAVVDWLREQGVPARVGAQPSAAEAPRELVAQIPLANGFDLTLVPLRTMDNRWHRIAAALGSYVATQNQIFTVEEHTRGEGMVLVSPAIRRAHLAVVEAAQRGLRVLLSGPSGSGKDGLARCYHRNSGRAGAFVEKNCSMFTREFLRVELFGAEKGAYTGAVRTTVGAVEKAHGGTLFLDEIGELSAEVQAMLLSFLDHGQYERLGDSGTVRTADVRIVSATNRDLRGAAVGQSFREDLWYRIAGRVIEVPPLCERLEDAVAFLQLSRLPSGVPVHDALTPAARTVVLEHRWPGNFRELMSFVAQVPPDAQPESISADACADLLRRVALVPSPVRRSSSPGRTGARLDVAALAGEAADAFRADVAHELASWDDVKQYVESYLKPLLFANLSGAARGAHEEVDIAALASVIEADRGTVRKHLRRFLERFWRGPKGS